MKFSALPLTSTLEVCVRLTPGFEEKVTSVNNITYFWFYIMLSRIAVYTFVRHYISEISINQKLNLAQSKGENHKLKWKKMKKKLKLFLLFIILSFAIFSCYPLNQSRYGDQGNRHQRHQQDSRDQGDRNHYTPRE